MSKKEIYTMKGTGRRPIRVLYTTHASNLTGASRSLLDMLAGLPGGEVAPTVLLRKHGPLEKKLDEINVPYVVIPHVPWVNSKRGRFPDSFKRFVHMIAQPRIDRYVRRGGFDLVHSNSLLCGAGMIAARKAGIPYVSHIREMVKEGHGMHHLNGCRARKVVGDASRVICISKVVAQKYKGWYRKGTCSVIHDGIDVMAYCNEHGELFTSEVTSLLMAGGFAPGKGQFEAIQAAELLLARGVQVHLTLVGEARDAAYRRKCDKYILAHHLEGHVESLDFHDDISALRALADISLTCSTNEAMGRVTAEGMMAGCLAIVAKDGAALEIVSDGETGYLYESNCPSALATCVEQAIMHREESRRIAHKGQHWACEHFDMHAYGKRLVELYRECLFQTEKRIGHSEE